MKEVAEGVYRLGTSWVNWYLIRREEGCTVVDSAFPDYFEQLPTALSALGARLTDVRAVVLTHNHSDHVGAAERIRAETGAEVYINAIEAPIARGDAKSNLMPGMLSLIWRPTALRFMAHAVANGGMKPARIQKLNGFDDGRVLEVPGRLRVVATPGHSPGHSALLLEDSGILFSGDGLVTRQITNSERSPQLLQINEDRDRAIASLAIYERVDAELLLPGHGGPWSGTMSEAVARARALL